MCASGNGIMFVGVLICLNPASDAMAAVRLTPQRIGAIILLLLGLFLMIRLVLLHSRPPAATGWLTATAMVEGSRTAAITGSPGRTRTPVSTAAYNPQEPLLTTRPRTITIPPDFSATPSPPPTSTPPATSTAPPAPPTAAPPPPDAPPTATVPPTLPPPTATPLPPTPTPTQTPTATSSVRPKLINNEVDPPWWPCQAGQVKVIPKLQLYYTPDQASYPRVYVGVDCLETEQAAIASGYRKAP